MEGTEVRVQYMTPRTLGNGRFALKVAITILAPTKAAFTRQRTASFPFSVPHFFFRFRTFTRSKPIRGGLRLYRFQAATRE